MTKAAKQRSVPNAHMPLRFRSVLIPIDFTPISDRVLARVARLPLGDAARLTLLHVVPETLRFGDRRAAERSAKRLLAEETKTLAKSIPKGVSITSVVKIGAAAKEIAVCARSTKADLVVMGRGGGSALRDVFLGSTAERVIRRITLPVLAVRLPARAPYRRPAIALEFDQAAHDALAMMLRMISAPRLPVTVIHAFDVLFPGRAYMSLSEEDAEEWREESKREAARKLANLLVTSLARAKVAPGDGPMWRTHIRYGSPRLMIKKAVEKANTDLLVLGTRGYTGLMHLFLGTVAGDVLREVSCDVLVVPPRSRR
jgi:nucleotide-binding universal stress UspA family protein